MIVAFASTPGSLELKVVGWMRNSQLLPTGPLQVKQNPFNGHLEFYQKMTSGSNGCQCRNYKVVSANNIYQLSIGVDEYVVRGYKEFGDLIVLFDTLCQTRILLQVVIR